MSEAGSLARDGAHRLPAGHMQNEWKAPQNPTLSQAFQLQDHWMYLAPVWGSLVMDADPPFPHPMDRARSVGSFASDLIRGALCLVPLACFRHRTPGIVAHYWLVLTGNQPAALHPCFCCDPRLGSRSGPISGQTAAVVHPSKAPPVYIYLYLKRAQEK